MAFQMNARTKILAGVAVLVIAGGGAGVFFFDDIMDMISPPPPKKVASAAPKPAAEAAKAGDAAKSGAEAPKAADAAKPGAAPAKVADAKAPAAAAAAAAKKPIPTDPDQLIAEVVDVSGLKAQIQNFAREVGVNAKAANQSGNAKFTADEVKALYDATARIFEPQQMTAEIHATLKSAFDADRMTRFLEILRQPLAVKMVEKATRPLPAEETQRLLEDIRKNPPSAQRQKVVQALDELSQSSETGVQLATLAARETMDAMFTEMQKAGKQVPKQARQFVGSRIVSSQGAMRSGFRTMFYIAYRDASDEELAEYVKLLDTDVGRWGLEQLAGAQRAAVEARVRPFAKEVAQIAVRQAVGRGAMPVQIAAEEDKPAEKLATAATEAAPKPATEEPSYKRAPNTREIYTRYNDLITAAVMRDKAAVKELLDDGKYPDVRQKDGVTPLMIAASNGDVETATLLLGKGADPNLRAGGKSALSIARERNAAAMVQLLQSKGAKE